MDLTAPPNANRPRTVLFIGHNSRIGPISGHPNQIIHGWMASRKRRSTVPENLAKIDALIDAARQNLNAGCGYMMVIEGISLIGSRTEQTITAECLRRLLTGAAQPPDVEALFRHLPHPAAAPNPALAVRLIARGLALITGIAEHATTEMLVEALTTAFAERAAGSEPEAA